MNFADSGTGQVAYELAKSFGKVVSLRRILTCQIQFCS